MEEDNIYRLTMEEVLLDKRRRVMVAARQVQRTPGDEHRFERIPMLSINMGGNESYCVICQRHDLHRRWMRLICDHKFHHSCLMEWFNTSKTCPICRT
ncbi:hypothetical protein TNIN_175201 [Trichonephila inaurata madagascariensis]|uniref:RING-type domain-containing protein n=1 Tax=Trichonephila inaurata madagascariensis TaxID=2747483 RepID=A0A8X6XK02_9ARAC|nr:hypothetical protein TNIN_175201 [Trichonephila inaurata madagascariensis]